MSMPGLENRQGCTKCHMLEDFSGPTWEGLGEWYSHHRDDSNLVVGSQTYDGDPKGTNGWEPEDGDGYYRFLRGHQGGDGHGACGIEDPDWEATSSSTDHNEYLGFSGTKTSSGSLSALGHTVTGFCCGCHGNFHIEQDGGGDWIRHASDGVLPTTGEYAAYTTYDVLVPVARPDLDSYTGPDSTVTPGTDMAMCISCHRAHGSPYPKMLRWDMNGCKTCHTSK
jgi:predicted CXXCH cytochrome family protein